MMRWIMLVAALCASSVASAAGWSDYRFNVEGSWGSGLPDKGGFKAAPAATLGIGYRASEHWSFNFRQRSFNQWEGTSGVPESVSLNGMSVGVDWRLPVGEAFTFVVRNEVMQWRLKTTKVISVESDSTTHVFGLSGEYAFTPRFSAALNATRLPAIDDTSVTVYDLGLLYRF